MTHPNIFDAEWNLMGSHISSSGQMSEDSAFSTVLCAFIIPFSHFLNFKVAENSFVASFTPYAFCTYITTRMAIANDFKFETEGQR